MEIRLSDQQRIVTAALGEYDSSDPVAAATRALRDGVRVDAASCRAHGKDGAAALRWIVERATVASTR